MPAFRTWQEAFQQFGQDLELARWAANIGHGPGANPFDPYAYLEQLSGRAVDRAALQAWRRPRTDALIALELPLPGVSAYLAEARERGLGLAIASSSPVEWVEGHLMRLRLRDAFKVLSCAGNGVPGKPAPDVYLRAVDGLGLAPGEAIALDDSATGVAAAKAAGLFVVAVPNQITAGLDFGLADLVLPSLAAMSLAELLARAAGTSRASGGDDGGR